MPENIYPACYRPSFTINYIISLPRMLGRSSRLTPVNYHLSPKMGRSLSQFLGSWNQCMTMLVYSKGRSISGDVLAKPKCKMRQSNNTTSPTLKNGRTKSSFHKSLSLSLPPKYRAVTSSECEPWTKAVCPTCSCASQPGVKALI